MKQSLLVGADGRPLRAYEDGARGVHDRRVREIWEQIVEQIESEPEEAVETEAVEASQQVIERLLAPAQDRVLHYRQMILDVPAGQASERDLLWTAQVPEVLHFAYAVQRRADSGHIDEVVVNANTSLEFVKRHAGKPFNLAGSYAPLDTTNNITTFSYYDALFNVGDQLCLTRALNGANAVRIRMIFLTSRLLAPGSYGGPVAMMAGTGGTIAPTGYSVIGALTGANDSTLKSIMEIPEFDL